MKNAVLTVFVAGLIVACGATEPATTPATSEYAQLPLSAGYA